MVEKILKRHSIDLRALMCVFMAHLTVKSEILYVFEYLCALDLKMFAKLDPMFFAGSGLMRRYKVIRIRIRRNIILVTFKKL